MMSVLDAKDLVTCIRGRLLGFALSLENIFIISNYMLRV